MRRITAQVSHNLPKWAEDNVDRVALAVTRGVTSASADLQRVLRGQVVSSGLGRRLANTWRREVYPQGGVSPNAAALVFSKAPEIVGAHARGALVKSASGFWLAVPLPAAGKSARGGRISPAEWERRNGRRLKFIFRRGRSGLLVDDGTVLAGARVIRRDGFSRAARGFRNRTVPIFALVPQVRLRKRLSIEPAAQAAAASLPGRIRASLGAMR